MTYVLKSPEQVLRAALLADAEFSADVGTRVYPVLGPASAALPFATYRRTSVQREHSLSGPVGVPSVTVAFDLFSETYEGARELADKARMVLDGYGDTLDDVEVKHVTLENEVDGYVQLAGGDLPPVYSVTQYYSVLWQET